MTKHPDDEPLDRQVHDLPDVPADAEFRGRLKSAFVKGAFAEAPKPAVQPVNWWKWAAVPLAACLVIAAVIGFNRGPGIKIADVSGDGTVTVDGRAMTPEDFVRLEDALKPGQRVVVPAEMTVDLQMGDVMMYEIAGGTEMTLPGSPGRWFGRTSECRVDSGEIRVMTGKDFHGKTFTAHTPEGMARITGTLISVQCGDAGTCVCVVEGTALVGTDEADLKPVTAGKRRIMMRDGTEQIIPILPLHREGALNFESRFGEDIQR